MPNHGWVLLTGEFPPQPGGVSDYCHHLARHLRQNGDQVEVWAPKVATRSAPSGGAASAQGVRELPGSFGLAALWTLHRWLKALPRGNQLIVEYVPQAFGWRGMNLPFCLLLWWHRRRGLWTMFHEVAMPLGRGVPFQHQILGVVHRLMAAVLLAGSTQVFVSIPHWSKLLAKLSLRRLPEVWAPIPSNCDHVAPKPAAEVRSGFDLGPAGRPVVGHFGTYGPGIAATLAVALPSLLAAKQEPLLLLLGYGSEAFAQRLKSQLNPVLAERVKAASASDVATLAGLIDLCDVLVQPYPDGVSSRRSSVMAALSLGKAVVTTSGELTEALWLASGGVGLVAAADDQALVQAVLALLSRPSELRELGAKGLKLYKEEFSWEHLVALLHRLAPQRLLTRSKEPA